MVVTAIRGALGFLTRLPVGRSERAWRALGDTPAAMVPAGYVVGGIAAVVFVLPFPAVTVGLGYVLALLAITGIAHVDGLADAADAAVAHASPSRRRAIMKDTAVGAGGAVAVGVDLVGLALVGVALAAHSPLVAIGLVVAAEVGAKLAMVTLAVFGRPTHDGMGERLTGAGAAHLAGGVVLAAPAAALGWPSPASAVALVTAVATGLAVLGWARMRVGGVTGDVFGATNELARLAALHAGVIAWTLS